MDQEEVWDNVSGRWNEFRVRRPPVIEEFVSRQKGRILDLGCGSGRNFMKVKGLDWAAVDFSGKMVEFAEGKARKLGMEVDIVKSVSTKVPFEGDSFDAVLCFAVLHCVDTVARRKKTLREIFRVLKKGGEALIGVWEPNSPRLKNKPKEGYIPWTVGDVKYKRYNYIYDLDELVGLCKSVGFEVVSSREDRNIIVVVRKPSS